MKARRPSTLPLSEPPSYQDILLPKVAVGPDEAMSDIDVPLRWRCGLVMRRTASETEKQ